MKSTNIAGIFFIWNETPTLVEFFVLPQFNYSLNHHLNSRVSLNYFIAKVIFLNKETAYCKQFYIRFLVFQHLQIIMCIKFYINLHIYLLIFTICKSSLQFIKISNDGVYCREFFCLLRIAFSSLPCHEC